MKIVNENLDWIVAKLNRERQSLNHETQLLSKEYNLRAAMIVIYECFECVINRHLFSRVSSISRTHNALFFSLSEED